MAAPRGNKREVLQNYYLGIPTQSRIIKSYQLFLALSRYRELLTGGAVLSSLEGELHDLTSHSHPMPTKGIGIPKLAGRVSH